MEKVSVIQKSLTGEFLGAYVSSYWAEHITGVDHEEIIKCAGGDIETAGGFKWEFAFCIK